MEKNNKKYISKEKIDTVINNVKNGMKSDKVRKALLAGLGVTCIAAGVYSQNPIVTKVGNEMVKDIAVDSAVNLGKDLISNNKLSEIIDLTKEKVKMSDIQNQEKIMNKEIEINKDSINLEQL